MKNLKLCIKIITLSILGNSLCANELPKANILAAYGYFDDENLTKRIESKCHVKLSHDTYNSNYDFYNIFRNKKDDFDAIIMSNLIYGSVKDRIPNIKSNLHLVSNNYDNYFKAFYNKNKYYNNTAIFTFAMVGFLYNPKVIKIAPTDNLYDIFKKAKNKKVILVDDSGEIGNLLTQANQTKYHTNEQSKLTYKNLKSLTQNSQVYITSEFNNLYKDKDFAFAYVWSGDALLYEKKSNNNYKFTLPIKASTICMDLVVQMKNTVKANCVASQLASKDLENQFTLSTYYLNPYMSNYVSDNLYSKVFNTTKNNIENYKIIKPVHDFETYYNNNWEKIKEKYLENEEKN